MASNYGSNYSRDQMKNDLEFLCNLHGSANKLNDPIIKAILHNIAWAWTEQNETDIQGKVYQAKIKGCKYWTKEAFEDMFIQDAKTGEWKEKSKHNYGLRHEHIVPKNLFKTAAKNVINGKSQYTCKDLENAMEKCLIGCVVTNGTKDSSEQANLLDKYFRDEMPNHNKDFWKVKDPWDRYKEMKKNSNKFTDIYIVDWKKKGKSWSVDKITIKDISQM